MKKILFFIPTLGGGGAEKVLVNLVNNLDEKKYDITVQTLFDYGINRQFLKENIKYKYFFKKIFRGNIHILKLFSPKILYKYIIKENYDIIVSYLEGPTTRIVSGCQNKNTKLISWVHTEVEKLSQLTSSYRSYKEMEKSYLKYDYTVFVANTTRDNFNEITKIKLKNEIIIRNVIDTEYIIEQSKNKIENDESYDTKECVIVNVGRLTKSKGHFRLLEIHKKLIEEGIKNKLWILGEGEEKRRLENYIKDNNLQGSVKLLGYKENPYQFIAKANLYVCSSYIEGYSTAVTEAVILEKPVITTKCSGMDEILDNGKYGIIVENNNEELYKAIKEMLLNKNLLDTYKKLAIERKKYFDINNQIKQAENLFDNC